jgi:long-chain fatty acid transport protein
MTISYITRSKPALMKLKTLLIAAALIGCGSLPQASAQTNDFAFRSFSAAGDLGSARAAGLGGAFVAVADDSSATFLNPAGLGTLPKTELAAGVMHRGAGTSALGDGFTARTSVGYVGGAGSLSSHWAIGGYLTEPMDERLSLGASDSPGPAVSGYLRANVRDVGMAASWHPTTRLYLGLRLNDTHLNIESLTAVSGTNGATTSRVGFGGGQDKIAGDLGLLFHVNDQVQLGATFRQGVSWNFNRTADDPSRELILDKGSNKILRSPSVVSGGLAYRPSPRWLLSGQADLVRYSEGQSDLGLREAGFGQSDYRLRDAVDLHAGVETTIPVGVVSLLFRGGIYSQAAGALEYTASDPVEKSVFPARARVTRLALGAAIWSRSGLHADGAVVFRGDRPVLTLGIGTRF